MFLEHPRSPKMISISFVSNIAIFFVSRIRIPLHKNSTQATRVPSENTNSSPAEIKSKSLTVVHNRHLLCVKIKQVKKQLKVIGNLRKREKAAFLLRMPW